MKTDKKKLMRKLIAIGLMATMLATNTVTYGSNLILPSINAEALTISETGAITLNISTMEADPESGIIEINITEDGTYIFTGTNLRNEGEENECYIDVQVTVISGVTANFIFDGLQIKNDAFFPEFGSGNEFKQNPFIIEGTVNLYIKDDSSLSINADSYYTAYCFISPSENGIVNVIESEDNAKLEFLDSRNVDFNMKGGRVECGCIQTGAVTFSDGVFVGGLSYPTGDYAVIDGGYANINYIWPKYVTFKNSSSESVYSTTISGLPANAKVTELNGKKFEQSYTDADGNFKTYLTDLSQNGFVLTADGVVYVCASPSGDASSGFTYSAVKLIDAGTYKLSKVYDGTTALTNATASGELELASGAAATPDLTTAVTDSANAGEYTVAVPVSVEYGGGTYSVEIEVPVEITPAPLSVNTPVEDKVYDGTTDATVTEVVFNGLINSDILTEGTDYTVTAAFADANAGTDKAVNVTVTLKDTDIAKNYRITSGAAVTADITAAPLTISGATVENKTYDGEKTATVSAVEFDGVVTGEKVDYTATAAFADEKIGTAKDVTVTVKLADTVKNYTLDTATYKATADIIAKGVTIADVVVESKAYDGKTDAKVRSVTFKNEKGEVITPEYEATAVFADAAAGVDKEVTVTLKDSTYTLTESKFTTKANITYAGMTANISFESVADKPSLPKADNFVDKEVNGEGLLVVKSPKTETKDYYFAYLVKSDRFKIGDAAPKTGTFYVALNDKGEKTRKFTVSIPFTTVYIDGKTYKAPEGYAYYVLGITDVPTKYELYCSENIELN